MKKATKKVKEKAVGVDPMEQQNKIMTGQVRTLNELWGRVDSRFKQASTEEYEAWLNKTTSFDLQQECIRIGLVPHFDRRTMIARLLKECSKQFLLDSVADRPQQVVLRASEASDKVLSKIAVL